jgi:hypothetical protein
MTLSERLFITGESVAMAHEGLWRQLVNGDGPEAARRAKCGYEAEGEEGRYIISFLNRNYQVEPGQRKIYLLGKSEEAGFLEQLCILAYLIGAKDKFLTGKLVKAQGLAGGDFFFRGVHDVPTDKLAEAFGKDPEKLYDVIERFNGQKRDYGDASLELLMLPRLPLTVVIWGQDEEFSARSSILFDAGAAEQIALDALGSAVNLTVKGIIETAGED